MNIIMIIYLAMLLYKAISIIIINVVAYLLIILVISYSVCIHINQYNNTDKISHPYLLPDHIINNMSNYNTLQYMHIIS